MAPKKQRRSKQDHTFDGPAEEYINEYQSAEGPSNTSFSQGQVPDRPKKGIIATLGKIMNFLHR